MANNQVKKILIFSTAYLPLVGGAEVAVDEITKRLPDWQFDMVTAKIKRGLADFERIGNVNIYRVGFGFGFDKFLLPFMGLLKAVALSRKENYQIIWAIMASQAAIAAMFLKVFYRNKKFLLTLQEGDPEKHLKRYVLNIGFLYKLLIRPWHILSLQRADYLTAISNDLKKRALDSGVKVPIEIVPNGVDLEKFFTVIASEAKQSSNEIAASQTPRNDIIKNEKVILTVSRLVKKNGIDDLIKAGQYLDFPFKILIVGEGPDEGKLKKLAKKIKLENKILFLGHINHSDLPKYHSMADIFIRSSLSEGLGNVFLEAMAMGLPIIGTPIGGIPDFLEDRKTGLFCEVNNPQDIAKKVKEILDNELLRKTLAENGLDLVRERYNWDKISEEMRKVFVKNLQINI